MRGNHVVREARRRAGLSQSDLAARIGTTQSAIARLERGKTMPSIDYVTRAVRGCGYDLAIELVPYDEHEWTLARENLALDPSERVAKLKRAVRFIDAARRARAEAKT